MRRRVVLGAAVSMGVAIPMGLHALDRPEKNRVTLFVQGWTQMAQLPLVLAVQLGFFQMQGLQVEVTDLETDQALYSRLGAAGGGEVPVFFSGPFEQVLWLRSRGVVASAFAQLARTHQVVVGVSMQALPGYRNPRDLAGRTLGVDALNTPGHRVARLLLLQSGVAPQRVQFQAVGGLPEAVQAFQSGRLHAIAGRDPLVTQLEQDGGVRVLLDTRVPAQSERLFGGAVPGMCLGSTTDVMRLYPGTCQAMVHGVANALQWLRTAGPGDLIKALPEAHLYGDRARYLAAFTKSRNSFSTDTLITPEAAATAYKAWARLEEGPVIPFDLGQTHTNRWSREAKTRFRI